MMELRTCFVCVLVFCIIISSLNGFFVIAHTDYFSQDGGHDTVNTAHSREFLLSLKNKPLSLVPPNIDIDYEGIRSKCKKKRGSRGGIRNRIRRRGARLPMPSVTLTNARSLVNKMEELQALVQHDCDYRRSNIICVTETWFSDDKSHSTDLDGFTTVRLDRCKQQTGKEQGGGLIVYVNKDWATNITVRETVNTPDYEILSVSFRPHYLPREFTQVSVILAYVPGPDDDAAAERIAECYNAALSRSADQPVLLLGDFNTCDVSRLLPNLRQYVTQPTHNKGNILDKCFVNIPDAYADRYLPPLGKSDHCVIHLLPTYRQQVKREGPKTRVVRQWNHDTAETLRGCYEMTDWNVFFDDEENLDTISDSITSYILFCEDNVIPKKAVKIYSNTKPWVNVEMKKILTDK